MPRPMGPCVLPSLSFWGPKVPIPIHLSLFTSLTSNATLFSTAASQNQPPTMATGVDAKLLKSTKFPPEFNQKVDMQKVNLQVMKKSVTPASPPRQLLVKGC